MKSFTFIKCTRNGFPLYELETIELRDLDNAEALLEEVASFHARKNLAGAGWHTTPYGVVYNFTDKAGFFNDFHIRIIEK